MAGDNTFDKFKKSVNRGITTISVKTQGSMEKSKISMHIDSLEKEIEKTYSVIGKEAYAIWESEEKDFSALTEKLESIRETKEKIEGLKAEIESIEEKNNEILGKMNEEAEVALNAAPNAAPNASPAAGIDAPAGIQAPGAMVCPNCGQTYDTPVRFCRKCGQSLA